MAHGDIPANTSVVGTFANRPSAASAGAGARYFATDTVAEYVSTGSVWIRVGVPAGAIIHHPAASAIPDGTILANGATGLNRTVGGDPKYSDLYDAIGTTYGGTGETSFNLPDYQGRVLVGVGTHADVNAVTKNDGVAVANRRAKHSHTHNLSISSSGTHNHSISDPGHAHNVDNTINYNIAPTFSTAGQQGIGQQTIASQGAYTGISVVAGQGAHTHTVNSGGIGVSGMTDQPAWHAARILLKL